MVMKPYGMWNWITNKCSIPPSFPWLSFFHHPPLYVSHSLLLPPPLSPVSLSSNKAATSNWNSMLSRSVHLIYKIKLKASHARMAFHDDEEKEEGLFQLHTITFLSCDLLVPGGDTFFLSPAMMCQMPHLKPLANASRVMCPCISFSVKLYLRNVWNLFNMCCKVA